MRKAQSKTGRRILCDKCCTTFRGAGMTRVMRKIVFHFCPRCWSNPEACEAYMLRVAWGEKLTPMKETACGPKR